MDTLRSPQQQPGPNVTTQQRLVGETEQLHPGDTVSPTPSVLDLVLEAEWWERIKSHAKFEEYRAATARYASRLLTAEGYFVFSRNGGEFLNEHHFRKFDVAVLRHGYASNQPKDAHRILRIPIIRITYGKPRPGWVPPKYRDVNLFRILLEGAPDALVRQREFDAKFPLPF